MRGSRSFQKFLAGSAAVLLGQFGFAQAPTSQVVVSGDAARDHLGSSLGLNFDSLFTPYTASPVSPANSAAIAFQAELAGATLSTDLGIWVGVPNDIRLAAREGDASPGISGGTFTTFSQPQVDGQGKVAFFAIVNNDPTQHGIWRGFPTSISLLAKTGDTAPGFGGGTFSQLADGDRAIIASNHITFRGIVTGGDVDGLTQNNNTGIFISNGGAPQLAVRENSIAPGTSLARFADFTIAASVPVINNSGQVVFRNSLSLNVGDTTSANNEGIWVTSTSGTAIVVRENDEALGSGGPVFDSFATQPSLNNAGTIAYRAILKNAGTVTTSNDSGIWIDSTSTGPTLLAREGDSAPVSGPSATYGDMINATTYGRAIINSSGKIVFAAPLTSSISGDQGLFIGTAGSVTKIARKGETAPGTGGLGTFSTFVPLFTVNAGGQTAFMAGVAGLSGGANEGIFAVDPWNEVVAVAVEGQSINFNGGPKEILPSSGLALAGNSTEIEGRSAGLTDTSIVTFTASFTDGSAGVYNARVGGPARVKNTAPTLGASVSNSFFTSGDGLDINTPGTVSGDIGYLKFKGYSSDGINNFTVYLDFTGTNIAGAQAELEKGGDTHGYSVAASNIAGFELMLLYAGLNDGTSKYFYWNFANIDNVDLTSVMVTPEPTSMILLVPTLLMRRRRRATV